MRLTTILLSGAAVIGLGSAAYAADLIIESPIMPVVESTTYDWTGFYVGVHAGYGAGVMNLEGEIIEDDAFEQDVDGFFGGVQLGYNVQLDSILLGVQTDLSLSGIASDEEGDGADDSIDWLGSTTGRIGFVAGDFVPYLKGGVAYAGGTGNADIFEDSQTHVGWTAGAGLEFALSDNMSVFGEYNYYAFGEETYEFDIPATVDVDAELHTVKAGLNFGF